MSQSTEALVATIHTLIKRCISSARHRKLTADLEFRGDLGATDLDVLQLIMDVEDHLLIDLSDEEAESIKTVGDLELMAASKEAHGLAPLPVTA